MTVQGRDLDLCLRTFLGSSFYHLVTCHPLFIFLLLFRSRWKFEETREVFFFSPNICRVYIFYLLIWLHCLCCDIWEICCIMWNLSLRCVDSKCVGSAVTVCRLSCLHGIWDLKFPDQGLSLHPLHQKVDSFYFFLRFTYLGLCWVSVAA